MSKPRKKPPEPVYDLVDGPPAPPPAPFVDLRLRPRHSKWSASPECRRRLADLKKLIMHRHGGGPCDTDDGATYLAIAVSAFIDQDDSFILSWARTWMPSLAESEIAEVIRCGRDRYERFEPFPSAQAVGNELNVTLEEREGLDIRTMRPAGWTNRRFRKYQLARLAEKARARAAATGSRARTLSKAAVARVLGISLATYKRDLKAGKRTHPPQGREPDSSVIELSVGSEIKPAHGPAGRLVSASRQTHRTEVSEAQPARVQRAAAVRDDAAALARIRAGAKIKPDRADQSVPVALPGGEFEIPGDLLSGIDHAEPTNPAAARATADRVIAGWTSGRMPDEVIAAIEAKAVALGLTNRSALARSIGIDRGTWSNAARREFGLGAEKVALVKAWLAAA